MSGGFSPTPNPLRSNRPRAWRPEMSGVIDFWFSIGSTYTYLTVMRIDDVGRRTGVTFRWCPYDVRAVMVAMDNISFSTKPVKARYMWRDLEAARRDVRWAF